MKKNFKSFVGTFLVLGMTYAHAASTQAQNSPRNAGQAVITTKEIRATVTDINRSTREVTIQTENGQKQSFIAGSNIRNLDQVKKGDVVVANLSESIVTQITKGGEAAAPTASRVTRTARPGAMPGKVVNERVTTSVTVSAMDLSTPSVTFKNSEGDTKTLKVQDADALKGINVGDRIDIVYNEAIAIRVEKDKSRE
jgi:hypothetical protein